MLAEIHARLNGVVARGSVFGLIKHNKFRTIELPD